MDTAQRTHLQPAGANFLLPNLPNTSTSSLMDAVVGGTPNGARPSAPAAVGAFSLGRVAEEQPLGDASASARVNSNGVKDKQDAAEVRELELKLEKRRSLIPHLENELAALEAQIKAAEERLSRVQQAPPQW
ncbi:uncharacterized protein EHS24_007644 [Apiotrichum porosum]|uniref:Uncharacterized protein n=1 Tax=Apiotrichum porosum TaxID=105984 RepID=A0A427XV91_9TREE|nr:uncharacterized protein EHS24_007644 [Apiotrichum porosum]RSH82651.1 hypothetical protein EHS24_007644 [Apiotrichum porosum]